MKKIFTAANPMEAHLFKAFLIEAGVQAVVQGELTYALRGEIPMTTETLPQVCVINDEDYDRARELLKQFETPPSSQEANHQTWRCSQCGQTHEAQFTSCWKCGEERPGMREV